MVTDVIGQFEFWPTRIVNISHTNDKVTKSLVDVFVFSIDVTLILFKKRVLN